MKSKKEMICKILMAAFVFFILGAGLSVNAKAAPKLNKTKITLTAGSKKKLKVKNTAKKVKWSSKNKAVASVNQKGVVKAKKKGITTIIAKVGKKKLRCKVVVKKAAAQKATGSAKLKSAWNTYVKAAGEKSIHFLAADYDGNGTKEAFGITGTSDGYGGYTDVKIYFINSAGTVKCIRATTKRGVNLYGWLLQQKNEASGNNKYFISISGKKFIVWEISAHGSGSLSVILGVRNGESYEPYISENYMDFQQRTATECIGLTSDFSKGYHDYIEHIFTFVKSTGQFVLK